MTDRLSQHVSVDKVEDVLLDRLEDLGQIQPDFDPMEWTKVTKSVQGYSTKGIQEHTIFGRTVFEDDNTVFKTSDEMTSLKTDNPKKVPNRAGKEESLRVHCPSRQSQDTVHTVEALSMSDRRR